MRSSDWSSYVCSSDLIDAHLKHEPNASQTFAESHERRLEAMRRADAQCHPREGNIYECLIEGYKHDLRNCWWIVDYNRQSLDATTADRMFRRFDDIFETCGWRVITMQHGKLQKAAFKKPGGKKLENWIDQFTNAEHAPLTHQPARATGRGIED